MSTNNRRKQSLQVKFVQNASAKVKIVLGMAEECSQINCNLVYLKCTLLETNIKQNDKGVQVKRFKKDINFYSL